MLSVTYSILLALQNIICAFPNMPEDFTPLYLSFSFRDDGSIFDGLVEEDDKDKAKR